MQEKNPGDLEFGNSVLRYIQKEIKKKKETDHLDSIKIKNICSTKDAVKRMKTKQNYFVWEKIIAK